MAAHFNIKVFGRVQGVFFRASCQHEARKYSIGGYVENCPDGSVYIEAEGEKSNLNKFVSWCKVGPPMAEVVRTEVTDAPLKNFQNFTVR